MAFHIRDETTLLFEGDDFPRTDIASAV